MNAQRQLIGLFSIFIFSMSAFAESRYKELTTAIQEGDFLKVRSLVESGIHPDPESSHQGRTALMLATGWYANYDIAAFLLAKGAGVNYRLTGGGSLENGQTALWGAISSPGPC